MMLYLVSSFRPWAQGWLHLVGLRLLARLSLVINEDRKLTRGLVPRGLLASEFSELEVSESGNRDLFVDEFTD